MPFHSLVCRYRWDRDGGVLSAHSTATITWNIPTDYMPAGATHRIRHFGTSKALGGKLSDFEGTSPSFTVAAAEKKYAVDF